MEVLDKTIEKLNRSMINITVLYLTNKNVRSIVIRVLLFPFYRKM